MLRIVVVLTVTLAPWPGRSQPASACDPRCDQQATAAAESILLMLDDGRVLAARHLAERLTDRHPPSWRAWAALGLARHHGVAGDVMGLGHDRRGAVAAYERAHRLAPDNVSVQALLIAALLEYAGADWTADPAERARARAVAAEGSNHLLARGDLALFDDEPAKALALYRQLPRGSKGRGRGLLVAGALVDGPEAALRDARETSSPADFRVRVGHAAKDLERLRYYPAARAFRRAVRSPLLVFDPDPLWTMKRFEPGTTATADPVHAASALVHLLLTDAPTEARAPFVTGELAALFDGALPWPLSEDVDRPLHRGGTRGWFADAYLTRHPPTPEPVGAGLVRVELATRPPTRLLVEVVGEGQEAVARVAAIVGTAPAAIGRRIDRALSAGDRTRAATWSRLARDPSLNVADPLRWDLKAHHLVQCVPDGDAAAEPRALALAAAALLGGGDEADRRVARRRLDEARAQPGDAAFERCALAVELSLLEPMAVVARLAALAEQNPADAALWTQRASLLRDRDCAASLAVLQRVPPPLRESPRVQLVRGHLIACAEGVPAAIAVEAERVERLESAEEQAKVLNTLAWYIMFSGGDLAIARQRIERARRLSDRDDAANTHLALLALMGDPAAARAQWLARRRDAEAMEDHDWLLWGLITEAEGSPAAARAAYLQVRPHRLTRAASVGRVALARLAELPAN